MSAHDGAEAMTAEGRNYMMLIGGEWCGPGSGQWFSVANPATGMVIGQMPVADAADVDRAIAAASAAFGEWSQLPAAARCEVLRRAGDIMVERADDIAPRITAEEGKPLRAARAEVLAGAEFCYWYAEEGRRGYGRVIPDPQPNRRLLTIKQPVGVAAAITPWNVPFSMIIRKAAPALAAGCTIVVKPAEQTPVSGIAAAGALHDAGAPPGVVNVVTGDPELIGGLLLSDNRVRKVSFTGSTEVGQMLMRSAADRLTRVSLELGGTAPVLIFDDADLDLAARDVADLKFRNAGQACVSANRIYIQDTVHDEVTMRLSKIAESLVVGNGADAATQVGPLIDGTALAKVTRLVDDAVGKGARALTGGHPVAVDGLRGYFYAPTVLAGVPEDAGLLCEEIFGPVAPVLSFSSEDEAIRRANATPYGLAAYVYTENLSRAIRVAERLDVGMVGINDQRISTPEAPFGGLKLSGFGREGGAEGLEAFQETKLLAIGIRA
jgi:succinate-semialdehyde dehydrogenase / glutarate-semialdehyde dehydrogenase